MIYRKISDQLFSAKRYIFIIFVAFSSHLTTQVIEKSERTLAEIKKIATTVVYRFTACNHSKTYRYKLITMLIVGDDSMC